ncbi:MAG: signal peptide peptidase SppA [Alphaproteobacteria bacterium]
MPLPPEALAERRRLTRRVVLWRTLAAAALIVAVLAWSGATGLGELLSGGQPRVAALNIRGVITSDQERSLAIAALKDDDAVKALILRIDSPGGTFVGSDDLHRQLREIAATKPVVAIINDVAASGGYMAAIAADQIFARRGSITASVGVIFQSPRVSRLMETVGIDMDVWRSGELKALPSPFEMASADASEQAQNMVNRLFAMFLDMVKDRRDLSEEAITEISDGRVVTGQHALELGLIDALGDEVAARAWLSEKKGVSKDLPTDNITPEPPLERGGLLGRAMSAVLGDRQSGAELGLSGLLALWRPLAPSPSLR